MNDHSPVTDRLIRRMLDERARSARVEGLMNEIRGRVEVEEPKRRSWLPTKREDPC